MLKMADDGKNVKFAASFILVELESHLVAFLNAIIIADDYKRHGLASHFVEFVEQLPEGGKYKGAFVTVGQSQKLNPHKFLPYKGFGAMPFSTRTLSSRTIILHT